MEGPDKGDYAAYQQAILCQRLFKDQVLTVNYDLPCNSKDSSCE